ncbi:phosphopantetheine-binding protein [Streptomyces sp. NPDC099050]|uniref:phosphopantetheine-binding protein n=1 Tax=Streptomyces sp. NPDC099050 TaxID=3366100 RepID=UPI0037FC56DC
MTADIVAPDEGFMALLTRCLPSRARRAGLEPEDTLEALGADSLAIVELIVVLETEYDVVFTDDLLIPETFESVRSLADAVARLREPADGSLPSSS